MNDYLAQVEKLRTDAAECALIRDLSVRVVLHRRYRQNAQDGLRVLNSPASLTLASAVAPRGAWRASGRGKVRTQVRAGGFCGSPNLVRPGKNWRCGPRCLQRAVRSIHGGKDDKQDDYGKNSQCNNRHGTYSGTISSIMTKDIQKSRARLPNSGQRNFVFSSLKVVRSMAPTSSAKGTAASGGQAIRFSLEEAAKPTRQPKRPTMPIQFSPETLRRLRECYSLDLRPNAKWVVQ
jgi:hypothetical protein